MTADPVRVTDGRLTYAIFSSALEVAASGTHGFSVDAVVTSRDADVLAITSCKPCSPGEVIPIGAMWGRSAFVGSLSVDGHAYDLTSGANDNTSLDLDISGRAIAPPATSASGFVQAPFVMTGVFRSGGTSSAIPLSGHGTANLFFSRSFAAPNQPLLWTATFVHYDFEDVASTPEPASLVLLGIGLATMGARRWRWRA